MPSVTTGLIAADLKCEHLTIPLGLNEPHPRFSWALRGGGRNRLMTGYQIVAGTARSDVAAGKGDLWDSGQISSAQSQLVRYEGRKLGPHLEVYWTVRVWDENGAASDYAEPAKFDTGLLDAGDWQAQWISRPDFDPRIGRMAPTTTPYDNPYQALPAYYFRRPFEINGKIRRARLYATALGLYEARINGERLGDALFSPEWTDYYTRIEYQLYDITEHLQPGENVLGFIVGEGWYSGRVANTLKRQGAHYGPKPAVTGELILEFEDGHTETIGTDSDWTVSTGPIVYSDFLMGEKYDARLDLPGWDEPGYDPGKWWPVEIFAPYPRAPQLDASRTQPVRSTEALKAKFLHQSSTGGMVFDLGQNIAGWVRTEIRARTGEAYTIRHAEALQDNGDLYTANLRSAEATDIYVAARTGAAIYEPKFTFHGFRYVEVSGAGLKSAHIQLTGIQINSDLPLAGEFSCGNDTVSRLNRNILWSQRGNFLSVPTDCPQRDERLGWLADAQVFWPTASFNMDVSAFFTKWMRDIADAQFEDGAFTDVAPSKPHWAHRPFPAKGAPAWGDGAVIMVWEHYSFYGDRDLVSTYWPQLLQWMDYIARHNPDLIRKNNVNNNYGDWLNLGVVTPKALVANAYWTYLSDLMARMAAVVGDTDHVSQFETLSARLRQVFVENFVGEDGKLEGDSQTGYLLALDFGLLDGKTTAQAKKHLRRVLRDADDHLATGFLGVRHLCPVLSDIGETDLAYKLLLNQDYPSWLFPVLNGATTIWERWDGWTPDKGFQTANMNSLNHYAYGAIGEWLFKRVAGIDCDPEAPGFERVLLRPLPSKRLRQAKATYQSHRGTIESGWEIVDRHVQYSIVLPPNTRGRVVLPAANAEYVCIDDRPVGAHSDVDQVEQKDGTVELSIGSGEWVFEWDLP